MAIDLLNLHIPNILENEKLAAIYIVNGEAKYVTLFSEDKFNLYKISNYEIDEYIEYSDTLGKLDFSVGNLLNSHILSQSAIHQNIKTNKQVLHQNSEKDIVRIVSYITDETNLKDLKKPTTTREENTRYISKKLHKLF